MRQIYPSLTLAGFLAYITIKAVVMYVRDVRVNRGLLTVLFTLLLSSAHGDPRRRPSGTTDTYTLNTTFQHCIAGGRDRKPPSARHLTCAFGKRLV